jgi:GNAT superfamily N-acetyltransferase
VSRPDHSAHVTVRVAAALDIPRIVELFEHGSLVDGKEDPGDLAPYDAALTEITRGPGAVLVAEADGEVVGVSQLIVFRHLQSKGGLCAEVESVHVHPDWRGQGIGRVLMGRGRCPCPGARVLPGAAHVRQRTARRTSFLCRAGFRGVSPGLQARLGLTLGTGIHGLCNCVI